MVCGAGFGPGASNFALGAVAPEVLISVHGAQTITIRDGADVTRQREGPLPIVSAEDLIGRLKPGAMRLADKGCDANDLRAAVAESGAWANIAPRSDRKDPI